MTLDIGSILSLGREKIVVIKLSLFSIPVDAPMSI